MKIKLHPASGIGDGLLMMIAAFHLKGEGHEVILSDHPIKALFPEYTYTSDDEADLRIIQNNNSSLIWNILKNRPDNICIFSPKPSPYLTERDCLFSPHKSMAENIAYATGKILGKKISKSNGLIPSPVVKDPSLIAMHPSSADCRKNWSPQKFVRLAKILIPSYRVAFIVSPEERTDWEWVLDLGIELPPLDSLEELKQFLSSAAYFIGNDSGPGHLASNLGIPPLTISGNAQQIRLWRPDFTRGVTITPFFPLPNFKGINLAIRDKHWASFVSVHKVLHTFQTLCKK